jgi:hypothetical protein
MSQIARTAVSMGLARGDMAEAVALDAANIPLRDFAKAGRDEGWTAPY